MAAYQHQLLGFMGSGKSSECTRGGHDGVFAGRDHERRCRCNPRERAQGIVEGIRLYRHVCPDCGSASMITLERYPAIRSMMGGTLDNKTRVKPTGSLWCASGQLWSILPEGIRVHVDYVNGLSA